MPREILIVVPPGKKPERLDVFLTHHVENATRTKVQHAIRQGWVLVDGAAVRSSLLVTGGENIRVTLPAPAPVEAGPEDIPIEIVYEDEHLLVVNKPAGMVTHPAYGNTTGTLVNAILHHCGPLTPGGDPTRPGIVHRLDKDTSGLLVVARSDAAHAGLARQFADRTITREYHALVWGLFTASTGVIDADLGRSTSDRKKIAVVEGGKHAVTDYEVMEAFPYLTFLRLRLRTGRTHQIRVHLAHVHHPVFGDPTYGGRRIAWGPASPRRKAEVDRWLKILARQALHAATLGFVHPVTGARHRFAAPLPEDMRAVLEELRRFRPSA
jgi:23S rRNA pseudouridine1911/1915/1917 synthase